MVPGETVLLASPASGSQGEETSHKFRSQVWAFLEANTFSGYIYEAFTIVLILVNVMAFIMASTFSQTYNVDATGKYKGPVCSWCDAAFVGDHTQSGSSILELFSVIVFTFDYCLRLWAAPEQPGFNGRLEFMISFFPLVDLVSILPFYLDLVTLGNLPATQFLRMSRLFRMLRAPGRLTEAFTLFDDVFAENTHLLATSGFVGAVVWLLAAGFYYVAERFNKAMIYCPKCPDVNTSKCGINSWGKVDCAPAECTSECWNLFESIPNSMYFTLLNLFGEYPLADRQSSWGMVVAVGVAVFAVFVFGIPTGIFGNGFSELLKRRKEQQASSTDTTTLTGSQQPPRASTYGSTDGSGLRSGQDAQDTAEATTRTLLYRFFQRDTPAGAVYDGFSAVLIVTSVLSFFVETLRAVNHSPMLKGFLDTFELLTVIVFSLDFILRAYSVGVDPKYAGVKGLWRHLTTFFSLVDIASIVPYWVGVVISGSFFSGESSASYIIRALRLLRLFRTERYVQAFSVFDDVLWAHSDVLTVTGFSALVFWVFFSAIMYYVERSNPDKEIAMYYRTIPDAMWVTLLNLSGESPLAMYTPAGQVITAVIGIFAVGFVGIPIGILGAGFQGWVEDHKKDTPDIDHATPDSTQPPEVSSSVGAMKSKGSARVAAEDVEEGASSQTLSHSSGSFKEQVSEFILGKTSAGQMFELMVLMFIFVTIGIAIMETIPGLECSLMDKSSSSWCGIFQFIEATAAITFTIEYLLRLYTASPSPSSFFFSFYSLVDLLAIVPWYAAVLFPGGWVDQNSSTLLMFRILRLCKLDQYVPSLTLIDDVFRLKQNSLEVTGLVALTLWVVFASLMYLTEFQDVTNSIDNIPQQGCKTGCKQADRYSSAFAAMPFTFIHLTGDYPIIEYTLAGRVVCFFMVICGVGLVGIPTGIVADGFKQVVETKTGMGSALGSYDVAYQKLGNTPAPREFQWGILDQLQTQSNTFLNGMNTKTGVQRSPLSAAFNAGICFLILGNVVAVLLESVPTVDEAIGNSAFNFFSVFETLSVLIFTVEYCLRLFSVVKDKEHLYSRWCYLTTFFGFVDLFTILPWYIQLAFLRRDDATVFRLFRLFRLLKLEHFITAFTKLDNVIRRSSGVLVATGVVALAIWISCAALFYIFEQDNPNWVDSGAFSTMPISLYYVAIFLGGEWAVVDFTFAGKLVCMFLCIVGIGLYAVPLGSLFDSFGSVLESRGLEGLEDLDDS